MTMNGRPKLESAKRLLNVVLWVLTIAAAGMCQEWRWNLSGA